MNYIGTINRKFRAAAGRQFYNSFASKYNSKQVRQRFLDYYIYENNHDFVKSSPVVPYHDPTLSFVNAGMNQFKPIFLGTQLSKHKKVANSQKCIRVGGKHNDLDAVGKDGYHHTFFEMLGNWSFGRCSKYESCKLAWNLLTEGYKIDKNCLYVTYFGGNDTYNIPADVECRDVWRSLGVPDECIIPFGMKENFWEMGISGPCGPSTEIHFDHSGRRNRPQFVNKGLHELVELWNIVFIEYQRDDNGDIKPLPLKHVDTGMGFERLVAILQRKVSNYDTDVFKYLFDAIYKNCKNIPKYSSLFGERDWSHINGSYRVLADHARMVTVALADGMIPEQNPKLRKVIRRAFGVCETTFKKEKGLLKELSNYVIENLGSVYPEIESKAKEVHQIINFEENIYHSLRTNAFNDWQKITQQMPSLSQIDVIEMPGLIYALKELQTVKDEEISPKLAFKLYDTYGLDEAAIAKLGEALNLRFSEKDFQKEIEAVKYQSKYSSSRPSKLNIQLQSLQTPTTDSFKYDYKRSNGKYIFNEVPCKVLQIVKDSEFVDYVEPHTECTLILDKTNLYTEAGGQTSDTGRIRFDIGDFHVSNIENVANCVLHRGMLHSKLNLGIKSQGKIMFDEEKRLAKMRNHTATHILNALLKQIKGATCQKSSKVTDKGLNLDVAIFTDKLSVDDVDRIERNFHGVIKHGSPISIYEVDSQRLLHLDNLTTIPGEIYPDNRIRIIEIPWNGEILSREPCCGTHLLNTADLEDFCIVNLKSLGRTTTSIHCVTGDRARIARKNGEEVVRSMRQLQRNVDENIEKPEILEVAVASLKEKLISSSRDFQDDYLMPYTVRQHCMEKLDWFNKQIRESARMTLREFIDMEMQNVMQSKLLRSYTNKNYIVHYLRTSMMLENVPLQKATRNCKEIPVIVISYADNIVKARCCVPEKFININFNAEKWLKVVGDVFNAQVTPPKGQDAELVCNMKGKKVSISDWHALLSDSLAAAKLYAKTHLK